MLGKIKKKYKDIANVCCYYSWIISISGFTDIVGITRRTDAEIKAFNQDFIIDNPTYNVLMSNCQDYVNALTNFLMVEGERKGWLPETETYRQ